jgi:hypothetical protein
VLTHYLAPSGKLYLKLQEYLAQEKPATNIIPLPVTTPRQPGTKKQRQHIPTEQLPDVLHRVLENQEPLRKVAEDYNVSHETVRRAIKVARQRTG